VISLDQVLAFGVTAFIVIAIPGPSVVFVIGRALAYGRRVALASVLGNALGFLTTVVLVAVGLGVVVQDSVTVFLALKIAGAAYLVWLGVEAVRRRRDFLAHDAALLGPAMTAGRGLRQGYCSRPCSRSSCTAPTGRCSSRWCCSA
jgi:threonine/homoserine/homoserine lactone efflux protein